MTAPLCPSCGAAKLLLRPFLDAHAWCSGCGAQLPGVGPGEVRAITEAAAVRAEEIRRPKRVTVPR